jgi:8-hydroxy-5-deazaflavin:NADPH oxidoreductase
MSLGHEVYVAKSRGPETLGKLTAETGATSVSVGKAAQSAELVIVDTGNYYPRQRDGRIEAIAAGDAGKPVG